MCDKVETSLERQEHFSQFQGTTDVLPCHIHLPVCLWIMDPHSIAAKKNTSHGNEALPQDTTHLIQRPCYQRGSPCQDPAGNRTTRTSPHHRKETQTGVVWTCLLEMFIRSGQNHLARHSERGKRQGRQSKRWEDNIRERTGLEFGKSQRAMENREKWRKLVAKSSMVPQRPLRLRDRWRRRRWWWWWWWWHRMQSYGLRLQRHVSSEGFWPRSRLIELIIPFARLGDVDSSQLTTRSVWFCSGVVLFSTCLLAFHWSFFPSVSAASPSRGGDVVVCGGDVVVCVYDIN